MQAFQSLASSQGWAKLVSLLTAQADLRANMILQQEFKSLDSAFEHAQITGERKALVMLAMLPSTIIQNLQEEIDNAIGSE